MKIKNNLSRWAVVVVLAAMLPAISAKSEEVAKKRVPKQIHTKASVVDSDEDHKAAETGFGAAGIGGHGKYFQYQHNPEHDHYEFGYRRGNDHHFQERYEKAAPHAGHFKTKVRWGDKHGGYGEHYYDYNHDGHGGEGAGDDGGADGGYSEPVPDYKSPNSKSKRQSVKDQSTTSSKNVDQSASASQTTQKRSARKPVDVTNLVFDVASGLVIDEETGQAFNLQPIQ